MGDLSTAGTARPVLVDRVPLTWPESERLRRAAAVATAAVVVVAAALVTGVFSQLRVPLPFTPVHITGATFAVLLSGAALGPLRGTLSQLLYVGFGLLGWPVFAGGPEGGTGAEVVLGTSGGYFLGFIIAAWAVGWCARRGLDRSPAGMAAAFALGTGIIYLVGAPWLAVVGGYGPGEALLLGVVPFLIGDAVKAVLAGGALPLAWRLIGEQPR